MKKYSIFSPLFLSFFSSKFYTDVAKKWKGRSFLYLLLLVFLVKIPILITMHGEVSEAMNLTGETIASQVPVIKINNGVVSTPENRPYYIFAEKKLVMIIDTTGKYRSLEDTEALLLLTRNALYYEKNSGFAAETRVYDLSEVDSFTATEDDVRKWANIIGKWVIWLIAPFWIIGSYIWRILIALSCALIGLGVASLMKADLKYSSLLTISILASTPALILDMILGVFYLDHHFNFLLLLITNILFIIFAIHSYSKKSDSADGLDDLSNDSL